MVTKQVDGLIIQKDSLVSSLREVDVSFDEKVMIIEQSKRLEGSCEVSGAKNAVLVSIASLLLVDGVSILRNVPYSSDVMQMIKVLTELGAVIQCDVAAKTLTVDTTGIKSSVISPALMKKMRASVLVMGPLLSRFGKADIALPGGCTIGSRPIDYHLKAFAAMGVDIVTEDIYVKASVTTTLKPARIVFAYPSVGATENVLMAAARIKGVTTIVNAALEPEVLGLIALLQKMGVSIEIMPPATIRIEGSDVLKSVEHTIIPDRLEAGTLLLATAVTGGTITLPNAQWGHMEVFLESLSQMGHAIELDPSGMGVRLRATQNPRALTMTKTSPYPGFPTDLQAPFMVALALADGESVVYETVFENRFLHVRELEKMGAHITVDGQKAVVKGIDKLYGASVIATDIRASAALVIAGLAAQGTTLLTGLSHWNRGYDLLEKKLVHLGARISIDSLT